MDFPGLVTSLSVDISRRFKSSFQTALAMAIAYGIALAMNWDKPYWAAFAIAFVSLSTLEDSVNQAIQRLLGTLAGAVIALTIVALSIQHRWLFILLLAGWIACATYLTSGPRHQYFWFVAGFVTAIIVMDSGPNSASVFNTAVLRTEQTALGIIVYSVVAALVWPVRKQPEDSGQDSTASSQATGFPDPQRLRAALRVMMLLWAGYLAVIYIPDLPGGGGFLAMLTPLGMIICNTPQIRPQMLIKPAATSIVFAGVIYVLLLPKLSSFTELSLVIFCVTFAICYLFYQPHKALGRAFGLAIFVVVTGIQNEQSYNFLSVVTTSLMFANLILLLAMSEIFSWPKQQPDDGGSNVVRA
jgi:hypothetical protein